MYIKNYINVYIFIFIYIFISIFIYNDASSPEKQILGSVLRASRCLSFEMRVSFVSLAFSLFFNISHASCTHTYTLTRVLGHDRWHYMYGIGGSIKKEEKKRMARSKVLP